MSGSEISFDFTRITALQFDAFAKALKTNDIAAVCAGLARVVVECPYGPADEAETFGNLSYMGEFQNVLLALNEALSSEAKKLKKR